MRKRGVFSRWRRDSWPPLAEGTQPDILLSPSLKSKVFEDTVLVLHVPQQPRSQLPQACVRPSQTSPDLRGPRKPKEGIWTFIMRRWTGLGTEVGLTVFALWRVSWLRCRKRIGSQARIYGGKPLRGLQRPGITLRPRLGTSRTPLLHANWI